MNKEKNSPLRAFHRACQAQRDAIIDGLNDLPQAVKRALSLDWQMLALAEKLQDEHSLLVFGREDTTVSAVEAALKVKEVSLMHHSQPQAVQARRLWQPGRRFHPPLPRPGAKSLHRRRA